MKDIVERLRDEETLLTKILLKEAAYEIEELRSLIEAMRENR